MRYLWIAIVILSIAFTMAKRSYASENPSGDRRKIISGEYLGPTDRSRDIKTVVAEFGYAISEIEEINLSFHFDITGNYATGSITQLEGRVEDGTFREVRIENSAFGLGFGLLANLRFFKSKALSVSIVGIGNFIIHDRDFPAGGDRHNFMWRVGPTAEYAIDDSRSLGVSYHRTHISNGRGFRPQNPSYDAHGIALLFIGFL